MTGEDIRGTAPQRDKPRAVGGSGAGRIARPGSQTESRIVSKRAPSASPWQCATMRRPAGALSRDRMGLSFNSCLRDRGLGRLYALAGVDRQARPTPDFDSELVINASRCGAQYSSSSWAFRRAKAHQFSSDRGRDG